MSNHRCIDGLLDKLHEINTIIAQSIPLVLIYFSSNHSLARDDNMLNAPTLGIAAKLGEIEDMIDCFD